MKDRAIRWMNDRIICGPALVRATGPYFSRYLEDTATLTHQKCGCQKVAGAPIADIS